MGPKNTAVIGATGNGKTVVAYDIAEEALLQNYPVLVLDPTGQWTGFLEECKSKRLMDNYPFFGVAGPVDFKGRIFTPNSDAGIPLEINLLTKPTTDDISELRARAKEVSELIKDFCNLTGAEPESVKNVIYNSWKNGKSLDHSSILGEFKDDKIKGKLEDLIAAKIVFEGRGIDDISSLWKPGEITIISLDKIRRRKNENLAMYYFLSKIVDYFDLLPDATEGKSLRLLLVIEEAHRFADKLVHEVLDRITRTLRKKGLGVLFVTQRFVDLGEMQTNVNTKIYMRTMHLADIERASSDIGALANKLPSLKTGVGIIFSPEVDYIEERYEPIIEFRPCLHRNTGLTEEEIRRKSTGLK
ncbi:MAG: helicase HerA-like domain-containing protein [Candidatus Nitrosotenuis sp.]